MTITITSEQRDALYEEFVVLLSGVDDLWRSVAREEFGRADRLARIYSDALAFVVTDLGWGSGSGKTIELKTEPAIVGRVVGRWRSSRESLLREESEDRISAEIRHKAVMDTCAEIGHRLNHPGET